MSTTQLQCLLKYLGYYEGKVDGISGPLTEAAVESFRRDNGNPAHGDELHEVLIGAVFYGRTRENATQDGESATDGGETAIGGGETATEDGFWSTVKYFGRHEFACKCGKCGGYPVEPTEGLVRKLDTLRETVGLPLVINSGIRCRAHNAAVGGADNSRHMYGDAADVACPIGMTPRQLYILAEPIFCDGGLGIYDWGIHVDDRGYRARW